jgi:predicted nucleic acid-binding protein
MRDRTVPILVPNLLFIEIGGAIRRRYTRPEHAEFFLETVQNELNITSFPLDNELARQSTWLAIQQGLRGADAVYAAVAMQENCILISLDNEHLTRLAGVVETRTPEQALNDLLPSGDINEEPAS